MTRSFRVILLMGVSILALNSNAHAQSDPPGRVGRLAYMQGTVSMHDAQQDTWSNAAINTPVTTGDSLWTEPNGHDEISISGTRVRMDGDTQLDMLAVDDTQTRMQLDQGRLDIKAFDFNNSQPYQIVTPRGTISLEQQGDYYIHAGSTDNPTLIGVRAGAAQFQTPNGQVLTVQAGQVGEVTGADNALQINMIRSAPPPQPAYWAQRDQQINYATPQYVTADVTGYEDLNAYGSWTNDPQYGEVWAPNAPPPGWAPYNSGYWSYVGPWGWTWIDSQPWGYAPYHYGRWAQRADRWYWVPPQRQDPVVYAPALVAFLGGVELGVALGEQSRGPVGWFPLGPHEAYVPPYSVNRNYYNRINSNAGVPNAALDDRWQRAESHQALTANQQNEPMMNRRFATVVPAADFSSSRPVRQYALNVSADKLAAAPVAPVAAPPAPGRPIASTQPVNGQASGNLPMAQTRFANMEEIGRPAAAAQHGTAPGPRIAARTNAPGGRPALPPLAARTGAAPPQIQGERIPAGAKPGQLPPVPQANRAEPARPGEPTRPEAQHPGPPAPQAQHPETQRAEPQKAEPAHPDQPARSEPARPVETRAAEPPRPAEPQRAEPQRAEPQRAEPQRAEPPRPEPPRPEPPRQAEAPHPAPQAHPEPPHPAPQAHPEPPHPAPPPKEEGKK
jgi:hypothetical protein